MSTISFGCLVYLVNLAVTMLKKVVLYPKSSQPAMAGLKDFLISLSDNK